MLICSEISICYIHGLVTRGVTGALTPPTWWKGAGMPPFQSCLPCVDVLLACLLVIFSLKNHLPFQDLLVVMVGDSSTYLPLLCTNQPN